MMDVNVAATNGNSHRSGDVSDHVDRQLKKTMDEGDRDDTKSSSSPSPHPGLEESSSPTIDTPDENGPKISPSKHLKGSSLPSGEAQKQLFTSVSKDEENISSSPRLRDPPAIGVSPSQPQRSNKSISPQKSHLSSQQNQKSAPNSTFSPTRTRNTAMGESPSKLAKPSPVTTSESIKQDKEVVRLKETLRQTSAPAAQQVLRDEWRTLLFEGHPEEHLSFILRAILKNSKYNPRIIKSALNDSKTLEAVLENPTTIPRLLGSCSLDQILEYVPKQVLDEVVAHRVKKAPATTVVKWLAKGKRLGYKEDDIIDEADEFVSPNITPEDVKALEAQVQARPRLGLPVSTDRDPLLIEQERNLAEKLKAVAENQTGDATPCDRCGATFQTISGSAYHILRVKCLTPAPPRGWPYSCTNCKQNFTGRGGWEYHTKTDCCGVKKTPVALSKSILSSTEPMGPGQASRVQPSLPLPRPEPSPPLPRPEPFHPTTRPPMRIAGPSVPEPDSTTGSYRGAPSLALFSTTPLIPPSSGLRALPIPASSGLRRFPSELSAQEKASLEADLQQATDKYNRDIALAQQQLADDAEGLAKKLTTIENGFASKKSGIRKKHGVTMRMRKSEQADRVRVANETMVSATPPHVSPPASFSPINGPNSGSKRPASAILPPPTYGTSLPSSKAYVATRVLPHVTPYGQRSPPAGGFGAAVLSPIMNSTQPTKRRSSETEHHSPRPKGPKQSHPVRSPWLTNPQTRNVSAPGLQMMEVHAEDAASKYKSKGGPQRPSMTAQHPSSSSSAKGTKKSAIVLTDSDSETDVDVRRVPVPRSAPEEVLASSIERDDNDMADATEEEG